MGTLPVEKCIAILNLFCAHGDDELWTNKIVTKVAQTTGSKDSPKIKQAIILLNKAKILEVKKLGVQKREQILTSWGSKIVSLINNVNAANNNFLELISRINRYQNLIEKDSKFKKTLKQHGWVGDDINSFFQLFVTFTDIVDLYTTHIVSLILSRFILLMTEPTSSDLSKKILTTFVIDEIVKMSNDFASLTIGRLSIDESLVRKTGQDETFFISPLSEDEINQLDTSGELRARQGDDNHHQIRRVSNLTKPFFEQVEKIFAFNYFTHNESIMIETF